MRKDPVYKEEDSDEQQHKVHAACIQQRTRLYVQLLRRLHDGWFYHVEPNSCIRGYRNAIIIAPRHTSRH